MTAADRKAMLRRELTKVSPAIYSFARMCERHPAPDPAAVAKSAHKLYLRVGKVAAIAAMLARESA